ncbi:alpha/beta fold hydrolase [Sphingobacterium faecale]|uniref:Alpha/beta hydrolase n=1 Tax=Sphingobacterium faecale TaxID=2803775 RepID=A0ABS1R9Q7_9SPHI|nr:alpha/beta hydrolase [Sphingobacterium faecale]MBL1411447.1 alpha/beta hydrolase [Sphingobacterium faecale]
MKKVYILSGLGVDSRVFDRIDFTGYDVTHLEWIAPRAKENMMSYAKRIAEVITEKNATIIGLSFGGMIAMEIAKIRDVRKIVLLASAKGHKELPRFNRIFGSLNLHRLVPERILKHHSRFSDYLFGISSPEESLMLKQILADTDPVFLKWAMDQIVHWKNDASPENIVHIHGDKDHIIPIKNIEPTHVIENAGHFMTISHAKEIEVLLKSIL